MHSGPVRHKVEPPIGQIYELATRSRSYDEQCLTHQLVDLDGYAFLAFCLFRQMSPEGENGTKHSCASKTLMAESTLVPNAVRVDDRTSPASARSGYIDRPQGQMHPLVGLNRLRLSAWKISGNSTQQQEFQTKLQNYCWQGGVKGPT